MALNDTPVIHLEKFDVMWGYLSKVNKYTKKSSDIKLFS